MDYFRHTIVNKKGVKMNVIDLFSGAGGLTEGFHKNGYRVVAQVEKDRWACETLKTRAIYYYLKERNDLDIYFQYLRLGAGYRNIEACRRLIYEKYPELEEKLSIEIINKKFGQPEVDPEATEITEIITSIHSAAEYNDVTEIDLIIGGPPCQSFSLVGRGRMRDAVLDDPRNMLFLYYKDIVNEFRPKAFIFENVPGILSAKKGAVFKQIKEEFSGIGYTLLSGHSENDKENILDFADYGVLQHRKRVLLFGYRSELNYHYPDFGEYKLEWNCPKSTMTAISDLPGLEPGKGEDFSVAPYPSLLGLNDYQCLMREDSIGILNHKARPIQEKDREIYKIAIERANNGLQLNYKELPEKLKTHNNQSSFLDRFKVHKMDSLPHTVVAHISKDGHYNIHPDLKQARSFTVREAARIQSFPDNFKFEGPRTAQYIQVGNAVPPLMSGMIAQSLFNFLRDAN
ncbi:DNA cytosine methyltransferase [Aneurinibacillus aneurinilyticus]|jgi:DNA (cytosine-5)-methyltransferase 1|uniref:DNA cytosine methyltransferase n=1 Tax=Aneurinibacillus aneurinilyticus TaxID=1391 RepID=UPI0023FA4133|nr:DNA cytosine methyltransferase [Aneurinibacillus aneurinilyticus]MCI1696639.1 DNA cytosine methyltransferase [Aneurinibacillus aneurinilyticus]